jgi:cyclic pyranopterin phosphate synthase
MPPRPRRRLTHLDAEGRVRMVDVGDKPVSERSASARAVVQLPAACVRVLRAGGGTRKGNVLEVARLAGIMAAKRTSDLIPLCHQVPLAGVAIELVPAGRRLVITATARCRGQTGVEMEALTAATVAALTVYDMLKAVSHDLVIGGIELLTKDGGRSGRIDRTAGGKRVTPA